MKFLKQRLAVILNVDYYFDWLTSALSAHTIAYDRYSGPLLLPNIYMYRSDYPQAPGLERGSTRLQPYD